MDKFRIQKEFTVRDDKLIIRVNVQKIDDELGFYLHEMGFVEHVDQPSWFSRKFFKETFEGRCDAAVERLYASAKAYIEKETRADKIIKQLKEKYQ